MLDLRTSATPLVGGSDRAECVVSVSVFLPPQPVEPVHLAISSLVLTSERDEQHAPGFARRYSPSPASSSPLPDVPGLCGSIIDLWGSHSNASVGGRAASRCR